eukprot:COSAG01_NODE_32264_length_584_cov_0.439175_1_plen_96_part_00
MLLPAHTGEEYREVPIYGPAGTCCIVDRVTIHTRLDPVRADPSRGRRIYHHVYARAGGVRGRPRRIMPHVPHAVRLVDEFGRDGARCARCGMPQS